MYCRCSDVCLYWFVVYGCCDVVGYCDVVYVLCCCNALMCVLGCCDLVLGLYRCILEMMYCCMDVSGVGLDCVNVVVVYSDMVLVM